MGIFHVTALSAAYFPKLGKFTMSPEQSRAARAWLGWSQKELARRAGVALNTVHEFEIGRRTPAAYIIAVIRGAIEAEGIRLLFDETGAAAGIARHDARIDTSDD
jgi:transcriptional regulator with XRE-family HTH domain